MTAPARGFMSASTAESELATAGDLEGCEVRTEGQVAGVTGARDPRLALPEVDVAPAGAGHRLGPTSSLALVVVDEARHTPRSRLQAPA